MIKGLDHIGFAVSNLEESAARWNDLFGLRVTGSEDIRERGVRVVYLEGEGIPRLELVASLEQGSSVERFIRKRGEGIHHICFEVEDIDAAMDKLRRRGVEFVQDNPVRGSEGSRIAFIQPRSSGGVLVELKQK